MIFEQKKFYVCCSKLWVPDIAEQLKLKTGIDFELITTKNELQKALETSDQKTFFFPHWSFILKPDVYKNHNCIMFHMTDLPFGRGGSPLQNLIVRGIKKTKISCFLCDDVVDGGPVFLKKDLDLSGNAQDIFIRANQAIIEMIVDLIKNKPRAIPQVGEVVEFKRRTPEESDLLSAQSIEQIFDMIRMLDAEGYPKAFLKLNQYNVLFENAQLENDEMTATIRIKK